MSWVMVGAAAVSVAGSVYSSNQQKKAAKGAANAQTQAAQDANATQLQMFNQSRQDQMPWLTTGSSALNKLAGMYGLGTAQFQPGSYDPNAMPAQTPIAAGVSQGLQGGGIGENRFPAGGYAPGSAGAVLGAGGGGPGVQAGYEQAQPVGGAQGSGNNFAAFYDSPDYQFALQQGFQGLDRSAAARGRLESGGYGQDLVKYGQGMAAQQLNTYTNRLAAIAGVGQTAANQMGAMGQNYANAYGQNVQNAGMARASGYAANANANSNLANGIGQGANYLAQYYKNNSWNQPTGYSPNDNPMTI